MNILEVIGFDEYGNFPFYFNRRTSQAIGGATSFLNLVRWATSDVKHMFLDPPGEYSTKNIEFDHNNCEFMLENMFDTSDQIDYSSRKEIGMKGMLIDKLTKGPKKAKQNGKKSKVSEKVEEKQVEKISAAERLRARKEAREKKKSSNQQKL